MTHNSQHLARRFAFWAGTMTLALAIHALVGSVLLRLPTQGQRYLDALAATGASGMTRVVRAQALAPCVRVPG